VSLGTRVHVIFNLYVRKNLPWKRETAHYPALLALKSLRDATKVTVS